MTLKEYWWFLKKSWAFNKPIDLKFFILFPKALYIYRKMTVNYKRKYKNV